MIRQSIMPVYQNKKTKKWKFRTYAEDVYGNHKQFERKWFDTKKEALQAEREFKLSDRTEISNLLFNELWTVYKEHISLKLKPQSYHSVVSRFNNYILPYFKDYRLNKITNSVYIKWQRIIEEKGFKHKYNSSLHGAMVTILNYAMKFYGLKQNIASMTGNFKRKTDLKKNVDFWTYEEYQTFISVVDDQVYKTFFETLYYTGLRQGECLALTWNDFINDTLDIHKTISKEKKDGKYIVNTPKTLRSIRKVKIDKDLVLQLQELKKFYQSCVGFEDNWYIFGGIHPLAPTTIGRKKDKYCALANVKKIRIHDFRHSHASLLLSKNVPIIVISERLGHSDINMTLNTYSHMIPNDEDKAIDILNHLKQNL